MARQRARQVHEKEERRQEILRRALALFGESGFQPITMARIARESQLAKGTIYIYFKSKEELFLSLTEAGLLAYFEDLDEQLTAYHEPLAPEAYATLIAGALGAQPHLPRLLGILHTVLEHNVDRLKALEFKEFLATRCTRTGRLLEKRMPFLSPGQGLELVLQTHCLLLGAWQASDPSPVVKELLQAPGLHIFEIDFVPFLRATLTALVAGLKQLPELQGSTIPE